MICFYMNDCIFHMTCKMENGVTSNWPLSFITTITASRLHVPLGLLMKLYTVLISLTIFCSQLGKTITMCICKQMSLLWEAHKCAFREYKKMLNCARIICVTMALFFCCHIRHDEDHKCEIHMHRSDIIFCRCSVINPGIRLIMNRLIFLEQHC